MGRWNVSIFAHDNTWHYYQRSMCLGKCKLCTLSCQSTKFVAYRSCGSKDIFLFYHVTSRDHVIKRTFNFGGVQPKSPLCQVWCLTSGKNGKVVLSHDITQPRSSHRRCSVKRGVLRNVAKFTGKHLYQSLFFNKETVNFAKFLRTPFLQNTSRRLLLTTKLPKGHVTW